ncbi:acyltransferase [Lacticaseibacillus yichunensis]|uniref:Acyltransferase n=1 Tax=Lacticaseibacillus yichunensis TaxID=2486015 RepID=A0ABW4CN02_9LACO|nr:acyltransferase [Lacticaseibacillus yichunensis]
MASAATQAGDAPAAATPKKKKPYLYEVDMMRIFFIFGVLLNHSTTAFSQQMVNATGWQHMALLSTHLLIHFTRMGFMFMTGLVLTLNYYHRDDWPTFFKKRFAGSGWPYLLWNFGLLVLAVVLSLPGYTWANFPATFWSALIHGDQFYLYYILVTLQLYLLFPLMVALFKHFEHAHGRIVIISFLIQLSLMFFIKYALPSIDRSNWLWWFRAYGVNVFTYQFYFIFGTYVSLHYQAVSAFIRKHIKPIATATGLLAIGTVPYYFWNRLVLDRTHSAAVSPHQPYMLIYDTMMIIFVFWLGQRYADWRKNGIPRWFETFVKNGAKISFGIYLDQTIGLTILRALLAQVTLSDTALLVLIPFGYLLVLGISFGIAWFCFKVPPFGILIGRPQWHILKHNRKGVGAHDRVDRTAVAAARK